MYKKFLAELVGTFTLAFAVYLSIALGTVLPVPVVAALVVLLFVYAIGPISGCHINPAVTLALLSLKKISGRDAAGYIVVQFIGAALAMFAGSHFTGTAEPVAFGSFEMGLFMAEALGAAVLTFGIASVVAGKTPGGASGLVIGAALLVGVALASAAGSMGILNPAVAFALFRLDLTYLLGPIAGALAGFWTYRSIA